MTKIHEIEAKTLLTKRKRVDSWFLSAYGMNIYRGCLHDCVYCDGRAEKYRVDGEFGKEVTVKINALERLERELDPKRKRTPFKKGFITIGGGVGDSYQPIEEKYQLTRKVLEFLSTRDFPVFILTKSALVLRDIDLLQKIHKNKRVIVCFSLSCAQDDIAKIFEPGASPPSKRLDALRQIKDAGIPCGVFLLPVIPFITDKPQILGGTMSQIKKHGADFCMFGGMTLKQGRQKDFFDQTLQELFPDLVYLYEHIYPGDPYGNATKEYYTSIQETFNMLIRRFPMPERIPLRLYDGILSENDKVSVMLDHLDYYHKSRGKSSPYGYASYSVSQLKEPLSEIRFSLQSIKGVGGATARIIAEILDTGKSSYLTRLMTSP